MAIAAVELVLQAGAYQLVGGPQAVGWRLEAITVYGFFDSVLNWMLETGQFPVEHLARFVTYTFVHGSLTHAAFAIVFILAIGKLVAEAFSVWAFLAIYILGAIVGSLAYGLILDTQVPLIGAYPAVYALIGSLTFMMFLRARAEGENPIRAFNLIFALLAIQLVFRLLFGGSNDWVADIAGFATGFALSFVLAPDGPDHVVSLLERFRRRK